ncbi:hypothetical protein PENVUL_c090G08929 [Penicillium vulpinum]|uniref:Fungal N-terminal domain-containing protein n=1 Tax=Penicillium vulpinum TaxID=29845 RepID=A0A1V6R5M3_9EURO|nr:hypothetical protein PENVUL_c090G08929 [Penicillium vulpinum]
MDSMNAPPRAKPLTAPTRYATECDSSYTRFQVFFRGTISGLEIVGIVASIVQIADLGAKISVKLCSFYRTVKNANDSMRSLSSDVSLTCSVLRELGKALDQDSQTKICSPGAFSTTQDVLKECRAIFEEIDSEIEKHDQEKGTNRLLRGVQNITLGFQGPYLDLLKSNLERLKSTMLLMLNVLMRGAKAPLTDQQNLIQRLLEEKKEKDTTFHQLSRPASTVVLKVDEPLQGTTRALSIEPQPPLPPDPSLTEVKEYLTLVRRLLSEIDACHHSLEKSRVLRIRNGVANVHSMEVSLFQHTHGHSATRDLHDPFFNFRESCLPKPNTQQQYHPERLSPNGVAEAQAAELDEQCIPDTIIKADDSLIDTSPTHHHHHNSHSPDLGRRRVTRFFNATSSFFVGKQYKKVDKTESDIHKRPFHLKAAIDGYQYPVQPQIQGNHGGVPQYMQNPWYMNPTPQQTNKYEEAVSNPIATNNPPPAFSHIKTVDRELEELMLQWTTLTREEMEIDVEGELNANK